MATDEVMASVAPAGGGGGALEAAAVPFSTLYCSNIDWKIKKQVLRRSLHALFSRHGKVRRCDLFCRCLPIIVSAVGAWVCDNWCPSRESVILPLCSSFLSLSPPLCIWATLLITNTTWLVMPPSDPGDHHPPQGWSSGTGVGDF